jgi:DNA-binding CsgD family transcriptional regulator/PAS domain-containing protein
MAVEMGADHPIVLEPICPATEDPAVQEFLRRARALTNAAWVELELHPAGAAPPRRYLSGAGKQKAFTVSLDIGIDFEATLRLGKVTRLEDDIVKLLAASLTRALAFRNLMIETKLLRGAMNSTSNSVLIFDHEGHILFANPPADHLLSLQTENELLARSNGFSRQPLFTLLSSLVDRVGSGAGVAAPWRGVIELDEGRVMACDVTRVNDPDLDELKAVLVVLQQTESESEIRVETLASSYGLSPREQEVLHLLGRGLTTAAMAEELGISPHTVRDHLKHLYRKTGTKGRSELLGLVSRGSPVAVDS